MLSTVHYLYYNDEMFKYKFKLKAIYFLQIINMVGNISRNIIYAYDLYLSSITC